MKTTNRVLLVAVLVAALTVADQCTKHWVVAAFALNESRSFAPPFLDFFYVRNNGAAFGIFHNNAVPLGVLSAALIVALMVFAVREKFRHPLPLLALAFVTAGASGNMIDRFRSGYVVDFLQLHFFPRFPIFNVADVSVTIGAVLFCAYFLRKPS